MADKETYRVLLVDDKSAVRGAYQIAVRDFGNIQVKVCLSMEDFMRIGIEFNPHYIMLGLVLPSFNLRRLMQILSETPELSNIPVITSSSEICSTMFH